MQGYVGLLPCPPERQKPPSAEYPAEIQTLGGHIRKHQLDLGLLQKQVAVQLGTDNTRVTQLGIGSHQPWILVFLSHQTVPGPPADSGHRDAGRRARGPPICSRLVAQGGRSGPWGRPRARWRSGSVGSGCPPGGSQWPFENGWRSGAPDLVSATRPASAAFSPHTRCDQHMLKPSELRSHPTP